MPSSGRTAEPVAEVDGGVGDLYVAMTRTTQRLHAVHALPLPAGMQA